MTKPTSFKRSGCAMVLVILAVAGGMFGVIRLVEPTPYRIYLGIKVGDSFSSVLQQLGPPANSHRTPQGTDYLFEVRGNPEYPKLLGVSFPASRIIRVQDERVVSKGSYEAYYDPHVPGWVPVTDPKVK